jgi:hypothetical protein
MISTDQDNWMREDIIFYMEQGTNFKNKKTIVQSKV